MRHLKLSAAICLSLMVGAFLIMSVPGLAQDARYWPGYHEGAKRTGWNPEVKSQNASALDLIWVFPNPTSADARMYDGVVDDNDIMPGLNQGLFSPGAWGPQISDNTVSAWNDTYYRMAAQYDPKVDKNNDGFPDGGEDFLAQNRPLKDPVAWQIASSDTNGNLDSSYRVYVWFPTILGVKDSATGQMLTPTRYAHYRVTDADGAKFDYIIDQSEGGKWIRLGDRSFKSLGSGGKLLTVQLERITKDALHPQNPINNPKMPDAADVFVLADAVKFVSDTGREIWASPAAGTLFLDGIDTPMVFVGTIEGPTASGAPGVSSLGAMYGVYSYNNPDRTNTTQQNMLGASLWKYPLDVNNPTTARPARNPVEGPIGSMYEEHTTAGVFSSPVYAQLPSGMSLPDGTNKVVIFGATDRQIYCLNATTGELVWKGPGLTVPEKPTGAWTPVNGRNDAFGGSYLTHSTSSGGGDTMVWDRGMPYQNNSDSWKRASYSVYAWIPAQTEPRPSDVTYNIYHCYEDATGSLKEYDQPATVTVDLSDPGVSGTWVLLGNNYWEPTKVELQTASKQSGKYVVADAVMFLPDEIRNFSYSSPMVNFLNNASSTTPESIEVAMPAHVFVGNTGGHVYSLNLTNYDPVTKTTELEWTFPRLQKGWNPSKAQDAAQPGLGAISSSVTLDTMTKSLYVTSTDGHIYKIVRYDGRDPKTETDPHPINWTHSPSLFNGGWVYPSQNPDHGAQKLNVFTSSPVIGSGTYVYAACTDGRLYRLAKAAGKDDPTQDDDSDPTYPSAPASVVDVPLSNVPQPPPEPPSPPQNPPADQAGLGAFRYSTPVVFNAGQEVIAAASTDGRVYAFYSDGTGLHPAWNHNIGTGDYRETATNVYSSMQASPAVDGGSLGNEPTLYAASQNGCVWWMGARTGQMPTTWTYAGYQTEATDYGIFASPAIANDYIYVGGTDGRLYAFSSSAWGGYWAGPDGMKPGRPQTRPNPSGTDSPQVDIFSNYDVPGTDPIYRETYDIWKANPSAVVDTNVLNGITGGKGIWRSNIGKTTADSLDAHKYAWRNDSKSSPNQHYVEWGESIYVIAWNLHVTDDLSSTISKGAVTFNMNNASSGTGAGMSIPSKPADWIVRYQIDDTPVQYAYAAGARIPIGHSLVNPPSPGSGWIVTCTVRDAGAQSIGLVPELRGSGSNHQLPKTSEWPEQKVGINNPLGIYTKSGLTEQKLGWVDMIGSKSRIDPTAHFNGNVGETTGPGIATVLSNPWPALVFGKVDHGTDSTAQPLGIVDRSAYSLIPASPRRTIDRFKIQSHDLHWLGGVSQVINLLPWDWPPPYQKDYPDIYQRYESFNQYPDGSDPSTVRTSLLPVIPSSADTSYDNCKLQPQAIATTVSVPRYQPANTQGYANTMTAFVDSNGDGVWESGNVISGRVTTYQEAYREFNMKLWVPPDFRMSVDESTIDIGAVPHGFGEYMPLGPKALRASNSYLPSKLSDGMDGWFKPVTVKNLGNVNLRDVKLARYPLFRDSGDISFPIPDSGIQTSLDDPFFATPANGFLPAGVATISKARVGDVDPTVFTLPDSRALEYDWNGIKEANIQAWNSLFDTYGLPAPPDLGNGPVQPKISVGVPLSQPRGIYGTRLGFVSGLVAGTPLAKMGFTPPMSQPFVVTVDVREDRLTDGFTAGALPMVDNGQRDVVGDVQPAAWRDPKSGNIYMIWASNRFGSTPVTPEDPWYLLEGELGFNSKVKDWTSTFAWTPSGTQWWQDRTPTPYIPNFGWPGPKADDPPPPNIIQNSIKHTSPFITMDRYSDPTSTWLFWQGQADFSTGSGSTPTGLKREYRIFYTNADDGEVAAPGKIYSFAKDPTQVKMQPRAVTYIDPDNTSDRLMWLFWYGGDNGRWQLYFCRNQSPADGHDPNAWSPDGVLTTPAALAAVSEPTPILRQIADTAEGNTPVKPYIDMIYTGLFKEGQNSDILMTRYKPETSPAKMLPPKAMPRQYSEVLKRDPKRNVYTSAHIGWVKPGLSATPQYDHEIWNTSDPANYTNRPFIKVVIPVPDKEPIVLFATSGAQKGYGPVTISVDRATGNYVYTYNTADPTIDPAAANYPNGKRQAILGQMIVDPSGGVVRFGKTLPAGAKVVAEYTPQALRITRGPEVDASPFAFLEKTENMNPGFSDKASQEDRSKNNWRTCPVDRLWVFWRKPNVSGVQTSTIYYKTYRFTLDLPAALPVDMNTDGTPVQAVHVTGNAGPYEIDPTGTRIYFTEKDERYASLNRGLPPIEVEYKPRGSDQTVQVVVDGLWTPNGLHNRIVWQQELPRDRPDQALLGYGADTQKNEGQVCAFADVWPDDNPWYKNMPTIPPRVNSTPTRIWVFWMSTRAGNTDLFYETLCPDLRMKGQ